MKDKKNEQCMHIMVDLETLGVSHNAVFPSLAAVAFTMNGKIHGTFKQNISIESAQRAGLQIEEGTLKWWLEQKPHILKLMFENPLLLKDVLMLFENWLRQMNHQPANEALFPLIMWGNSASFDLGILTNAFQKCEREIPWKFWGERCYRTMATLFPVHVDKPANAHDPLEDCYYQVKKLTKIWALLP